MDSEIEKNEFLKNSHKHKSEWWKSQIAAKIDKGLAFDQLEIIDNFLYSATIEYHTMLSDVFLLCSEIMQIYSVSMKEQIQPNFKLDFVLFAEPLPGDFLTRACRSGLLLQNNQWLLDGRNKFSRLTRIY